MKVFLRLRGRVGIREGRRNLRIMEEVVRGLLTAEVVEGVWRREMPVGVRVAGHMVQLVRSRVTV
jgi:hypothetical protein